MTSRSWLLTLFPLLTIVVPALAEIISLPAHNYACLAGVEDGCSSLTDAATCLSHRDGSAVTEKNGLKVSGQPCVWCGGGACTDQTTAKCLAFDYAVNGVDKSAFNSFSAESSFTFASCKNNKPAAATLKGYAVQIPGYYPPVNGSSPLVPWWVPDRASEKADSCLSYVQEGCRSIKDKATCLSNRDGSSKDEVNGLKVHGEPCVWCGGIPCTPNSTNLCEPFDYLMSGSGIAFSSFSAKTQFAVAGCDGGVVPGGIPKPHFDYTCLQPVAAGCSSFKDAGSCLSSYDNRDITYMDALKVKGEPCVWCGGTVCTDKNSTWCEPFDWVVNGQGQAFTEFYATAVFRIAACTEGKPKSHDYWGPTAHTPGALMGWTTPKPVAVPTNAGLGSAPENVVGSVPSAVPPKVNPLPTVAAPATYPAAPRDSTSLRPGNVGNMSYLDGDTGGSGPGGWEAWRWLALAGVLALCMLPFIAWALGWIGGKGAKKTRKVDSRDMARDSRGSAESGSSDDDSEEAAAELEQSLLSEPVSGRKPDLFDMVDTNHNESISEAEFAKAFGAATIQRNVVQPIAEPVQQAKPFDFFDYVDQNHDGVVTEAEMAAALGAGAVQRPSYIVQQQPQVQQFAVQRQLQGGGVMAGARGGQQPDLFDMVDRNHDGVISANEYASAFGQRGRGTYAIPRQSAIPRGSGFPNGSIIAEPIAVPPPPIVEPIAVSGQFSAYDQYAH